MASDIATRTHAENSPSRLSYLAKCPWWVGGSRDSGSGGISAAQRGTDLGQEIQDEIVRGISARSEQGLWAVETIHSLIAEKYAGWGFEDEVRLDTGIPGVSGYCDLLGESGWGEAVLIELKSGFSDRPAPPHNYQVAAYCLGVFRGDSSIESVEAHLVEVDKQKVFSHRYDRADVLTIHSDIVMLLEAASIATADDLVPGRHCQYCALAARCTALAAATKDTAPLVNGELPNAATVKEWCADLAPQELSDRLSFVLPRADLVETYAGALKQRAFAIIEAGGDIPGWHIKSTAGARKWSDESAAISALTECGIDCPRTPPTPAQAEKAARQEGVDAKAFAELVVPGTPRRQLIAE